MLAQLVDAEKMAASPNREFWLLVLVLSAVGGAILYFGKRMLASMDKRDTAFDVVAAQQVQQTKAMDGTVAAVNQLKDSIPTVCRAQCPQADECANFRAKRPAQGTQ